MEVAYFYDVRTMTFLTPFISHALCSLILLGPTPTPYRFNPFVDKGYIEKGI
jgi:hypothetical protein